MQHAAIKTCLYIYEFCIRDGLFYPWYIELATFTDTPCAGIMDNSPTRRFADGGSPTRRFADKDEGMPDDWATRLIRRKTIG